MLLSAGSTFARANRFSVWMTRPSMYRSRRSASYGSSASNIASLPMSRMETGSAEKNAQISRRRTAALDSSRSLLMEMAQVAPNRSPYPSGVPSERTVVLCSASWRR